MRPRQALAGEVLGHAWTPCCRAASWLREVLSDGAPVRTPPAGLGSGLAETGQARECTSDCELSAVPDSAVLAESKGPQQPTKGVRVTQGLGLSGHGTSPFCQCSALSSVAFEFVHHPFTTLNPLQRFVVLAACQHAAGHVRWVRAPVGVWACRTAVRAGPVVPAMRACCAGEAGYWAYPGLLGAEGLSGVLIARP